MFGRRRADIDIDDRYIKSIKSWSLAHGCIMDDYQPAQVDALQALRATGGDALAAGRLLYGQLLFESGRIAS